MTQGEFANKRGIGVNSITEWRKRLSEHKNKAVLESTTNKKFVQDEQQKAGNELVATLIQTNKRLSAVPTDSIELKHSSGFSILLGAQVEESALRKVLKCLSELTKDSKE